MSIFTRFRRNTRANVAALFALSAIPLVGAVGAAVDYGRIAQVHTRLGDALDAGILALGTQPDMTNYQARQLVTGWMDAHLKDIPYKLVSLTQTNGAITGVATSDVDMTVSRVLGVNEVTVQVTSQIRKTLGKIELALVLDNTGSMRGVKIDTLKKAATSLVDSLSTSSASPDNFRVGLVPFAMTVNVGSQYQNAPWIDAAGKSDSARSLFLGREVNRFDLFKEMNQTWGGCIETRPMPYETTDTFDPGNLNSLYVPYFAPDEPGKKGDRSWTGYNNSYLDDSSLSAIQTEFGTSIPYNDRWKYFQADTLKYKSATPANGRTRSMGYTMGPNSGCEIAPLMRLSSNVSDVKKAINAMIANGNTDIPVGMSWGWNVLSPNGPFGDGVAYDNRDWTKIVVLMTDGNNENEVGNQQDLSYYSGVGYVWQGRMGTTGPKWQRTQLRDERLDGICKAMKAKGNMVIYTIRVEVRNGSSDVLKNCASDPGKFFDVQNVNELVGVFNQIGSSIKQLRLAE